MATFAVIVAGYVAISAEITITDPDPGHVVIDEVAGQWVALFPVAFGAAQAGVPVTALWPGWVAAFFSLPPLRHYEARACRLG